MDPSLFEKPPNRDRKIAKNRFVRFLSISSSNRLGIGIFLHLPQIYGQKIILLYFLSSKPFSDWKSVEISVDFRKCLSLRIFLFQFLFIFNGKDIFENRAKFQPIFNLKTVLNLENIGELFFERRFGVGVKITPIPSLLLLEILKNRTNRFFAIFRWGFWGISKRDRSNLI